MLAAEWVDSELIDNINIRSRLSRNWRIARKNNESEEIQKACKKYQKQQKKTAVLSGKNKGDWEKKIEERWKNGKKFWAMIKELLGKNKEREEDIYVYTQEGDRKEIMEMSKEYIDKWKTDNL